MGHRCCSKQKVKRGLWSPEEDEKLVKHITTYGHGSWSSVPKLAGLQRCGKSCRLRWINYLRPDLKRGSFSAQEEQIIIDVHRILGNRWAQIAKHLPGRTDNEVKNFWNSCIKKKLISQGLDPKTHNLIPSHQRTNNNKKVVSKNIPQSHQQSFSIINVNPNTSIDSSMEILKLPLTPNTIQTSSQPIFNSSADQNPGLIYSTFDNDHRNSIDSTIVPPPSGSSFIEESYFWSPNNTNNNHNGIIVEPFEAQRMEAVEAQEQQNQASKSVHQDLDASFDIEFMESTLLSTSLFCRELNCIDDLAWNF